MAQFTKAVLDGIVTRLQAGESSIGNEAKALGMNYRTSLIAALRVHMGREAYDVLMATRRPSTGGRTIADRPRPDDKDLPLVKSMSKKKGWSWRYVSEHAPRVRHVEIKDGRGQKAYMSVKDTGDRLLIMIDPHGTEYCRADEFEKADLLRTNVMAENGPPARFVKYAHSAMRKRVEKDHERGAAILERGEAALDRNRSKAKKAGNAPPLEDTKKKGKAKKATKKSNPKKRK